MMLSSWTLICRDVDTPGLVILEMGMSQRQRIDHVLANWSWKNIYSHATVAALPIINSNHSPLILRPRPPNTSDTSFKYESFWEEHVDCKDVVKDAWSSNNSIDPWLNWSSKTSNCRNKLRSWHLNTFKNAAKEIQSLKRHLQ